MHLGKRFSAKEKKPFIICTEEKYLEELIKTRLPVYFFDPNRMPYSVCLNIAARISFALAWLAFIAEAKFVVTDRIHTAFPAISFDGNVNFPGLNQTQLPTGSSNRLSGFEALLNLARSLQIKNHEATESKEKIVKDISGGSLHILSEWSEMEMETKIYDLRESFSVYLMLLNKLRIKISTDIAKEYFRLGKLAFLDALKPVSTPKNQIIPDVVKDCFFWVDKTGYNVLSNLGEIKFDNSVAKIFYNNVRVVP